MLARLRAWFRTDLRILRWVFLALYLSVLTGSVFAAPLGAEGALWCLFSILVCQALFIFGSGTIQLCRPMRKRRLIFPIVVASFMMALLLFALLMATLELINFPGVTITEWTILGIFLLSWAGWGYLFWQRYRQQPRYAAMARLTRWLLAGSLLELLACVPMHVIVSRRPGCFVGLMTMFGIIAGCCVMCFAFGPAILLLFLRPRHREELAARGERYCDVCGYDLRASVSRCPECGTAFGALPPADRRP